MKHLLLLTGLMICACTDPKPTPVPTTAIPAPTPEPPPPPAAPESPPAAPDATATKAIEAADLCHHWGGEEPYDKKRAAEIAAGSKRDCNEAKRVLTESRKTGLPPPVDATISVFLEGETKEKCLLVPTADDPDHDVDDEARALCERFPKTPNP